MKRNLMSFHLRPLNWFQLVTFVTFLFSLLIELKRTNSRYCEILGSIERLESDLIRRTFTFSRFYVASCKLDRPKVRKTLVKYSNYRCRLSRKFLFFFYFVKLNFSLSFVAKWRCQSIFVIDSARSIDKLFVILVTYER